MLSVLVFLATLLPLSQQAEAWAQPAEETIRWNDALDQERVWYTSAEAIRIADNVLSYQDNSGGWPKNIDMAQMLSEVERDRIREEQAKRGASPNNITIDNGATHTQMRYLARVYNGSGHERFKESFLRGIDYLLRAQYDNGGWPQYYPVREGYYEQITFNDGAMVGVLYLLRDIATSHTDFAFVDSKRRTEIKTALMRGIESILRLQIRHNGKLTAWCAQHDKSTLEPAWARAYEPPSLSGGESVGIVRFLMSIEEPTPKIIAAIEGAVSWLKEVAIHGMRYEQFSDERNSRDRRVAPDPAAPLLWARFYELGSNRPIFLGRDSVVRYSLAEIEQERRAGYSYYGTWANDLLDKEYPKWKAQYISSENSYNFRPRVIHTTDLGADPDDQMSMVRHLVMGNWFDTEGLIVNTGCWRKNQSNTDMLDALLDAYGHVVANLQVHDPAFPSSEYLKSITVMGQTGYGMDDVGDGKDTAGSEMIIASVDIDDPRPLWATCWGGCNTIAQALWKVKSTRSSDELAEFVSKLHIYDILGQDNAGTWIAKTFPEILYIRATQVYSWQHSDEWADTHVQSHGPLGVAYPDPPWAYEGDSPAIFHLIPNGLHDPVAVDQGGWGGRFAAEKKASVRGMRCMDGEDAKYDPYSMYNEADESISRWKEAIQNDFEARMDWSVTSKYADANHHPVAILNGDKTRRVLEISSEAGTSVALSAAGSSDPDGDRLNYAWWFYEEPSSYDGKVTIQGSNSMSATVDVPSRAGGQNIHIVLEIKDNGSPGLTAYRRIIINVQ